MFDFISKWFPRNAPPSPQTALKVQAEKDGLNLKAEQHRRQQESETIRQQMKLRIDALSHQPEQLLQCLMQCDHADDRYYAAQFLVSPVEIAAAIKVFRNSDKRVTKLLNQRLDQLKKQAQTREMAEQCRDQAQALLAAELILPNQVIEWDKVWQGVDEPDSMLVEEVRALRDQIDQRLQAQMALQREALDLSSEMANSEGARKEGRGDLQVWCDRLAQIEQSEHVASLPKHLLPKLASQIHALKVHAHAHTIDEPPVLVQAKATPEEARTDVEDEEVVSHESAQAALERTVVSRERAEKAQPQLSLEQVKDYLQRFEEALEQGRLQVARQWEAELRIVDLKPSLPNLRLSDSLKSRLSAARQEMNRLTAWAKWSGGVSREELVATAEGLKGLQLQAKEIAETVSALRQQWKQLDATGAIVSKELWERFDTACTVAYAPAAEHFKLQSEQRKEQAREAQQLLDEWVRIVPATLVEPIEWRGLRQLMLNMQQSTKQWGRLDRKDKRELEPRYQALFQTLADAWERELAISIAKRGELIAEVSRLKMAERDSVESLKLIQQCWQNEAQRFPLPRVQEQDYWHKFRQACDAAFANKRQLVESLDQERQANFQAKLELCEAAKHFQANDDKAITQYREQWLIQWQSIGAVPRQKESALEKQVEEIEANWKKQIRSLRREREEKRITDLQRLIRLCHQLEQDLLDKRGDEIDLAHLDQQWQTTFDKQLPFSNEVQLRYGHARALAISNDAQSESNLSDFRQQLLANVPVLDDAILRWEILKGMESPESLARERLQKQVEVLQDSMKQGIDQTLQTRVLKVMMSTPSVFDEMRLRRWEQVLSSFSVHFSEAAIKAHSN